MSESTAHQTEDETEVLEEFANRDYEWGFITDIEADSAPPGLNEEIIRFISVKKTSPNLCSRRGSRPIATG